MINPNISRFVVCQVSSDLQTAIYKGLVLSVCLRGIRNIKPGSRRLYLKYSIVNERYYLSDRG